MMRKLAKIQRKIILQTGLRDYHSLRNLLVS